jgi:hypothetical protein
VRGSGDGAGSGQGAAGAGAHDGMRTPPLQLPLSQVGPWPGSAVDETLSALLRQGAQLGGRGRAAESDGPEHQLGAAANQAPCFSLRCPLPALDALPQGGALDEHCDDPYELLDEMTRPGRSIAGLIGPVLTEDSVHGALGVLEQPGSRSRYASETCRAGLRADIDISLVNRGRAHVQPSLSGCSTAAQLFGDLWSSAAPAVAPANVATAADRDGSKSVGRNRACDSFQQQPDGDKSPHTVGVGCDGGADCLAPGVAQHADPSALVEATLVSGDEYFDEVAADDDELGDDEADGYGHQEDADGYDDEFAYL